ncbi:hypothetical protein [Paraburkholderia gardini]|uniref:Uncharacterized protein n=1 Tax=Paraburkholderia gardini TaxID=2823469 RepID=A0ABM8UBK9_9BURK|nr:hypothetical protein [Paraburkholderia gardini]CAG4926257.1 hypothetical protein R54767_05272 [Paraburkholderia gardini]
MNSIDEKASLVHRAMLAYIGASGIPVSVFLISLAKHAGWKPVLIGLPVYLIIYGSITYQFIRDRRTLKLTRAIDALSKTMHQAGMSQYSENLSAIVSPKGDYKTTVTKLRDVLTTMASDDSIAIDVRESILRMRHDWT